MIASRNAFTQFGPRDPVHRPHHARAARFPPRGHAGQPGPARFDRHRSEWQPGVQPVHLAAWRVHWRHHALRRKLASRHLRQATNPRRQSEAGGRPCQRRKDSGPVGRRLEPAARQRSMARSSSARSAPPRSPGPCRKPTCRPSPASTVNWFWPSATSALFAQRGQGSDKRAPRGEDHDSGQADAGRKLQVIGHRDRPDLAGGHDEPGSHACPGQGNRQPGHRRQGRPGRRATSQSSSAVKPCRPIPSSRSLPRRAVRSTSCSMRRRCSSRSFPRRSPS